jgi:hypothetical protein
VRATTLLAALLGVNYDHSPRAGAAGEGDVAAVAEGNDASVLGGGIFKHTGDTALSRDEMVREALTEMRLETAAGG